MRHRLHVLDLGEIGIDKGYMLAGAGFATTDRQDAPAEWTAVPAYAVLLEHPEGRILFDTGCHPESDTRWPEGLKASEIWIRPTDCSLPQRLEELGLGPRDIDMVVASHLHNDHAGCLEFFSHARVFVNRDELRGTLERFADPDFVGGYVKADIAAWLDAGLKFHAVDRWQPNVTLFDGISLLNLGPGHVEGLLGMRIDMPETGTIILASDACYAKVNFGPPPILPGAPALYDSLGMIQTAERRRELERSSHGVVWFGHDPEQFKTLRKAPDAFYE